jgi:hypothetical protein
LQNPNRLMLSAIFRICSREWVRAFALYGTLAHLNDFNFVADGVKRVSLLPSTNGCDKAHRTRAACPTLLNSNFHFSLLFFILSAGPSRRARDGFYQRKEGLALPLIKSVKAAIKGNVGGSGALLGVSGGYWPSCQSIWALAVVADLAPQPHDKPAQHSSAFYR